MDQFANLISWAQANVETTVFYLLAFIALPLAYGVVFDRVIIRSGFLLIGVFGTISGLFLLLEAQFLAMAQIMIYAVGITLVVVIALMLTNPRLEQDLSPAVGLNKLPGMVTAFFLFVTIYFALRSQEWPVSNQMMNPYSVEVLGIQLMTNYALPFEFASVLLLAALMGAVMLAKAEPRQAETKDEPPRVEASERSDEVVKV
jgi:NADH:ubiquinone oxidoreductase subunit 6 (subunit J)